MILKVVRVYIRKLGNFKLAFWVPSGANARMVLEQHGVSVLDR
jgi:ribosome-associated protein YbcJ (S4-like RNA binding protein)